MTSCKVDDFYEGYHGAENLIRDLPVDWQQAADKSSENLISNFLPENTAVFGKEIYWNMSEENPAQQFRPFEGDIKQSSQLEAVKTLLVNYKRSKKEPVLAAAQRVLSNLPAVNESNYEELLQWMEVKLLEYEVTNEASVWAEIKHAFEVIESASILAAVESTDAYKPGKYGIPFSASDSRRTSKGNALGVIVATRMYHFAQDLKEEADTYKNFASNVALFCANDLYEDTGRTLNWARMDESGTIYEKNSDYYYANQGYMLGALVAMYNITKDENTLEFAAKQANYQISNNYMYSDYPVLLPNYNLDSNSFLGSMDRSLLLARGIFLYYLKDLVAVSEDISFFVALTNNAETMWLYGQGNEECLWGSRWYEAPFVGEYSSSASVDDPYNSLKVISLEAQVAGAILLESKATL